MPKPLTRDDFKPVRQRKRGLGKSTWLVIGYFGLLAALCGAGRLPWLVLGGYSLLSATTFGYYTFDKAAAQAGRWRTPEKTLHLLGLLGGWPGGLLAQEWIRHKSAKTSFQITFWATVILNCILLVWVASRSQAEISRIISQLKQLAQLI